MNKSLLLAVLLALPALAVGADLRPPVEIAVTGFKAKLADGRVVLTWRRYRRDDFVSYAIVKDKDANPTYPGSQTVGTFGAPEGVVLEDGKLSVGTWNYRLVITTRFGDRWVSPPVAVGIGEADLKRSPPGNSDFAD